MLHRCACLSCRWLPPHPPSWPACYCLALPCLPSLASSPCLHLQDSGTAKKLAFAREVNTRCITLEGDDFNPGGTLTGGSRNKGGSVLARLHELAAAEEALAGAQAALAQSQAALKATAAAAQQFKK